MFKRKNPLPGFGLSLGFTMMYLTVIVLLPLCVLVFKTFEMSWEEFWRWTINGRAIAAYKLTFGASFCAALLNSVFGILTAWVLVRYDFPCKRLIDALVDFPFALPTAVAGLTLAELFSSNGWIGRMLEPMGIQGVYSQLGVIIALTFVGMPFVIRTLQPVIGSLDLEIEEAAAILGASRTRTFFKVILPMLLPTIITGFALAFARAIGEYGSIVFISGNIPYKTEIAPVLIVMRLEEYNYVGATAIALVLLVVSFLLLALINWLQSWSERFLE